MQLSVENLPPGWAKLSESDSRAVFVHDYADKVIVIREADETYTLEQRYPWADADLWYENDDLEQVNSVAVYLMETFTSLWKNVSYRKVWNGQNNGKVNP